MTEQELKDIEKNLERYGLASVSLVRLLIAEIRRLNSKGN
jgi:hypothetical protein